MNSVQDMRPSDRVSALVVLLLALGPSVLHAKPARPVTVGVVTDGPLPQPIRRMLERTKKEALLLLGRRRAIAFPPQWERIGDWSADTARAASRELLQSPAVDLLVVVGPISTAVVADEPTLNKPVFAPMAIDPRFSGLPLHDGASGKRNFSYLVYQSNFAEDIATFQQMVGARTIHLVYDENVLAAFPKLEQMARDVTRSVGAKLAGVGVADSAEAALRRIPAEAHAVFVAPLIRMSTDEKAKLYEGLIARRLPSFTSAGRVEVKLGAMATQTRGIDYLRLARRTALNIERTLRGEDPATFPVQLKRDARLILNMRTARAVGFSPDWETLIYAEVEQDDAAAASASKLTLAQAMREALSRNWDVLAAHEGVHAAAEQVRVARAGLLPRIDGTFNHQTVRPEVADASFGSVPLHQGRAAAQLKQFLFIEPVLANLTVQKRGLQAREAALRTTKLDIVAQAASAYLDLLRAQTTARIEKNNALLTGENLESATIRRKLGATGPSDVYRWESQLAVDRRRAIAALAEVQASQAQLGQLLRRPQSAPVQAASPTLDDPTLLPRRAELARYMRTPRRLQLFSAFMVAEGLDAAPELTQLSATIAARRRAFVSRKRALYLPQVRLQGEVSYLAYRQLGDSPFAGLSLPLPDGSDFAFPETNPPRLSWFVGGALTLPLFTSLEQTAQREQARHELRQLERQREAAKLRIEARIRSALARARAANAAIKLARVSADAAAKNLQVITDAYEGGVANTVTLLDAQNNALVTRLAAATAVFDYMRATVELQRASGRFELFVSPAQRDGWFERLARHFAEHDEPIAQEGSK
jgi:outer membrane protein